MNKENETYTPSNVETLNAMRNPVSETQQFLTIIQQL